MVSGNRVLTHHELSERREWERGPGEALVESGENTERDGEREKWRKAR